MAVSRHFWQQLVFGRGDTRRWTQDSAIMPAVWHHCLESDDGKLDLLITPYKSEMPGRLAQIMRDRYIALHSDLADRWNDELQLAYNQDMVVARLTFEELIGCALPLSAWWQKILSCDEVRKTLNSGGDAFIARMTEGLTLDNQSYWREASVPYRKEWIKQTSMPALIWLVRLVGVITADALLLHDEADIFSIDRSVNRSFAERAWNIFSRWRVYEVKEEPLVWMISLNRPAFLSVYDSRCTIKADAASALFQDDCKHLRWAVIDSGIDARLVAFSKRDNQDCPLKTNDDAFPFQSRVVATYDFTKIRSYLTVPSTALPNGKLNLGQALSTGLDIDWSQVLTGITIPHGPEYRPPQHDHGTHVAGILGADWRQGDAPPSPSQGGGSTSGSGLRGICPNILLYDLRTFDAQGKSDEFSILAALQFVRWLNRRTDPMAVHGVNLSFSLRHEINNYACGRTPVCEECIRLFSSGVVVVAAAGNMGCLRLRLSDDNEHEAFQTVSVTDPGNAEDIITVGATHRSKPHTYGVSYFSSRGPTIDGRCKPDLVAPGEKISSVVNGGEIKVKDGTSMAVPHVSGAAALLMARNPELIGQPRRIKQILVGSATDLGRERYFQGAGLVDILRALQSI